jgi:hypothetical protein
VKKETTWNTTITVAIIGLIGTMGAALITNWDKVFGPKSVTSSPLNSVPVMSVSKIKYNTYVHPVGSFERQGEAWVEYPPYAPGQNFKFKEAGCQDGYLYLCDESRYRKGDPLRIMYLRFPIEGGMAQWSYPNPFQWVNLYIVTPKNR